MVQVVGAGVTALVIALIVAAHRHGAAGFAAVDRDVGVLRVEAVHLAGAVVEADHIHHLAHAIAKSLVHREGRGAGGVQLAHALLHAADDACTARGHLLRLFVAERPQDDAGMITATPHHRVQFAHRLGIGRHAAGFFDHQHAQLVAQREQCRRGRIVRAAVGIAAHRLELTQTPCVQGVRNGGADAGMVLVIVGAVQLERCAVQQETALRIEGDAAYAKRRHQRIDCSAVGVQAASQAVELGRVDRPQRCLPKRQGLFDHLQLPGRDDDRRAGRLRHDASIRCGDARLHHALARRRAVVAHFGGELRSGVAISHGAAHEHAILRQMQRVGLLQPHMPVNAGAFVKPAFAQRGIHADGDDVGLAVVEHFAEVDFEAAVAARVTADDVSIAEHDALTEHAIEHQADALAQIAGRNLQPAPIPAHAVLRETRTQRLVTVRGGRVFLGDGGRDRLLPKRQADGPVVR